MRATTTREGSRLMLLAERAADLMNPHVVSIRQDATVAEALVLLTDKGIGAAPVIDDAGRPIGVLSASDLLIHERERTAAVDAAAPPVRDPAVARDLMTPAIFSLPP